MTLHKLNKQFLCYFSGPEVQFDFVFLILINFDFIRIVFFDYTDDFILVIARVFYD